MLDNAVMPEKAAFFYSLSSFLLNPGEKSGLEQAFQEYLKRQGITGVWTQKHIDGFWQEREAIKKGFPSFLVDHPEYVDSESNRKKLTKWLDIYDLPATLENLTAAFNAIKTNLELQKIEPPPDPNKLEMRPGVWRNGRFMPDPNYVADVEVSYAQHSAPLVHTARAELGIHSFLNPSQQARPEEIQGAGGAATTTR